jgi:hypothetical protein
MVCTDWQYPCGTQNQAAQITVLIMAGAAVAAEFSVVISTTTSSTMVDTLKPVSF